MRVLVAGGHGFIGRRGTAAVAAAGHDAIAAGRAELDGAAAAGADALVWAAGGRVADYDVAVEAQARTPVRALASSGARTVVYLSSGEVYGIQDVPFGEDAPLLAVTPYARAKVAGEAAVAEACAAAGARLFVLRPAVVYGPGQGGPMLVPALTAALVAGRRFPMTPGAQTRDLVHVDDIARLIARCLDADAAPGTYNAASGVEIAVLDVVDRVAAAVAARTGVEVRALVEPGAIPYRAGDQMRYALDPTRARAQLGWTAAIDLDTGLAGTVAAALF